MAQMVVTGGVASPSPPWVAPQAGVQDVRYSLSERRRLPADSGSVSALLTPRAVHTSPSERRRLPADSGSVSAPLTPRAVHTSPSERRRLPADSGSVSAPLTPRAVHTSPSDRRRLPADSGSVSAPLTPRAVHTSPSDRRRLPADSGSVSAPLTPRAVHTSPSERRRLPADSGSVSAPLTPRAVHTSPSDRRRLPADSGSVSAPLSPRAVHTSPSERRRLPADSGSVSAPLTPRAVHTSPSERRRLPADSGSVSALLTPRAVHTSPSERRRLPADSGSVSALLTPRAVHTSPSERRRLPADSGSVSAPLTPRAVHTSPSERRRLPADSGSVSALLTPRAVHTSPSERRRLPADSGSVSTRLQAGAPGPDIAGARFMAQLVISFGVRRAQFCTLFPCVLCRVDSSRSLSDPPAGVGELTQCDFDDNQHPFCRWTRPHAGDWIRTQGLAPGESPGPPGGTPERAGFYVTPAAQAPGAVELHSPELAGAAAVCLEFLYYMYGEVAGSWLAVLPRGPAGYGAPQWNRTGLQSSAWLRGAVTLSAPPEHPFKVVFRAARTPNFDLALDSVSIHLGPCSPCVAGCDFDLLDDPCGWQNPPGTGSARWGQWVGAGDKPGVGPQDDFSKPGRATGADLGTPLVSLQGDQGADWQRSVVNYTGTSEIQFVFQGSYAEKPEPGLAVDSVWVWPCEETFTQCDFNNASNPLCSWAQPDNDIGSWIRTNQSTPTEETGPPGDYPHGEGYYIYAEAGSLQPGQSVSLESRDFCTVDAVCVEFYYYMAGIVQTGTQLRVLARGPSGPALPLWNRTGLQSPAWLLGSATVPAGRLQPTRIVFEVVRGNLPYLDVALDNVSVRRGPCPGAPVTPTVPGSSPAGTASPNGTMATATVATGTTPTGTTATTTIATGSAPTGTTATTTVATGSALTGTTATTTIATSSAPISTTATTSVTTNTTPTGTTATTTIATSSAPISTTATTSVTTNTTPTGTTATTTVATGTSTTGTTETTTIGTGSAPTGTTTTTTIATSSAPISTTATTTITTNTTPTGITASTTVATGTSTTGTTATTTVATGTIHTGTTATTTIATGSAPTGTAATTTIATGNPPTETKATTTVATGTTHTGTMATTTIANGSAPTGTTATATVATGSAPTGTTATTTIATGNPSTGTKATTSVATGTTHTGTTATTTIANGSAPTGTTATTTVATGNPPTGTMATTTVATGATHTGTTATTTVATGNPPTGTTATTTVATGSALTGTTVTTTVATGTTTTGTMATVTIATGTTATGTTATTTGATSSTPTGTMATTTVATSSAPTGTKATTTIATGTTSTGTMATAAVATSTAPTGTMATTTVETGTIPTGTMATSPIVTGSVPTSESAAPSVTPSTLPGTSVPCPPNAHYEACGPACPPRCDDPQPSCDLPCRPGCQCDAGHLLSGGHCAPREDCGCFYNHTYYQPGEVIYAEGCREICQCLSNNKTRCSDPSCRPDQYCASHGDGVQGCFPIDSATCVATGDPHYTTFDKRKFDFQGTCTYVLARPCNASLAPAPFAVHAANEHRHGQGAVAYIRAVFVELPGATVALLKNRVVQVNGSQVTLPALPVPGVSVRLSGTFAEVRADFGLVVRYDGTHFAEVRVNQQYRGALCGLCGDYNGDPRDDFRTPAGGVASSAGDFGDSWGIGNCTPASPPVPLQCPADAQLEYEGPRACGILLAPDGPFAPCHGQLSPMTFFRDCVFDLCALGGDRRQLCAALGGYGAQCRAHNVSLGPWRNQTLCREPRGGRERGGGLARGVHALPPQQPLRPLRAPLPPLPAPRPGRWAARSPAWRAASVTPASCSAGGPVSPRGAVAAAMPGGYYELGQEFFGPGCGSRCRCEGGNRTHCQAWQCRPTEICRVRNGLYGCHPTASAPCHVSGDPHYRTFDGRRLDFMGPCTYTLARPCGNYMGPWFSTRGGNEARGRRGVSYLRTVYVSLPGASLTLLKGQRTLINGTRVTLPAKPTRDSSVAHSGQYVAVETSFGLALHWDGNHYLQIRAPSSYSGLLCGLCGNYDGEPDNDKPEATGKPAADGEDLGNSWQTPDDEDPQCRPDVSDKPVCTPDGELTASCERIATPQGAFRDCHKLVSPTPYFENCLFDMCQYQGLRETLCAQLQAYTAACQAAGAPVYPWRGPQLCPLACPANSSYALCAQPCPPTCSPDFAPVECAAQRCVEGCECLPGFVLSGQECVPARWCGCTAPNGGYHALGEVWYNVDCSEKCACQGQDDIRCQASRCQPQELCQRQEGEYGCYPTGWGVCVAAGDPHYTTFDGRLFHFMGTCSYTLTQTCNASAGLPGFSVEATNEHRGASTRVSYVRAVAVEVFGHRVALLKGRRVTVDGQRVTLPVTLAGGRLGVRVSGAYALLQTDFGLRVRYDGTQRVEVQVPSSYAGRLCGLCGNYNGQSTDDNLTPNGTSAGTDADHLGESWEVPGASSPGCTNSGDPGECDSDIDLEAQKPTSCGSLTDPQGPFAPCHGSVPPADSFKSCHYDLCGTGGETTALCYALQSYADRCTQAGVPIAWRNSTLCPLNCPPGSTYTPCASPCPSSCTDLGAPNSCPALPCVEACTCNEGFVLSGETCVPLSQCGCSDADRQYHPVGESWMANENCTVRCTCASANNVSCEPWSCSPVQECRPEEGLVGCQDTGVASCHVAGDPHYFTFDRAMVTFLGTCTYTLVTLCGGDGRLEPFNVTGKNEERGRPEASYLRLVHVEIGGARFTLMKNRRVLVDGERVRTPVLGRVPGVSISTSGVYTELRSQAGLLVRFDGNQHLEIQLSGVYFGQVCGMCGNYNNRSQDDLALPSGRPAANATDFGNSWRAPGDPDPGCQPDNREDLDPRCSPQEKERFSALCREILLPKYQACHELLDPQPFIQSCLFDMCEYQGMASTLCDIVQAYAEACKSQGLTGLSWRNSTFCPLPCPPHSHYTKCASPCPATCSDLYAPASCPSPVACLEGCACDRAYVLSDETCVPMGECGCLDDQQGYHSAGDTWLSTHCSERCACLANGSAPCQPFQCPAGSHCALSSAGVRYCKPTEFHRCTISGDPHYRTFDRYVYHFQGRATYALTTTLATLPGSLPPLSVSGRNRRWVTHHRVSFLREVYVAVYGYRVTMMEGRKVAVNGLRVTPPFQPTDGLSITQRGRSLILQTDFGLSVSFDGQDHSEIVLPATYRTHIGGLCGNFDGRRNNEYTKPDGSRTRSPTVFGESWAVSAPWGQALGLTDPLRARREVPEAPPESGFEVQCSPAQLASVNGTRLCGALADPEGPFRACHGQLDPGPFQENCVYDVCAVYNNSELLCDSFTVYAQSCQGLGLVLPGWREATGCGTAGAPHSRPAAPRAPIRRPPLPTRSPPSAHPAPATPDPQPPERPADTPHSRPAASRAPGRPPSAHPAPATPDPQPPEHPAGAPRSRPAAPRAPSRRPPLPTRSPPSAYPAPATPDPQPPEHPAGAPRSRPAAPRAPGRHPPLPTRGLPSARPAPPTPTCAPRSRPPAPRAPIRRPPLPTRSPPSAHPAPPAPDPQPPERPSGAPRSRPAAPRAPIRSPPLPTRSPPSAHPAPATPDPQPPERPSGAPRSRPAAPERPADTPHSRPAASRAPGRPPSAHPAPATPDPQPPSAHPAPATPDPQPPSAHPAPATPDPQPPESPYGAPAPDPQPPERPADTPHSRPAASRAPGRHPPLRPAPPLPTRSPPSATGARHSDPQPPEHPAGAPAPDPQPPERPAGAPRSRPAAPRAPSRRPPLPTRSPPSAHPAPPTPDPQPPEHPAGAPRSRPAAPRAPSRRPPLPTRSPPSAQPTPPRSRPAAPRAPSRRPPTPDPQPPERHPAPATPDPQPPEHPAGAPPLPTRSPPSARPTPPAPDPPPPSARPTPPTPDPRPPERPAALACPPHTSYQPCTTACPASCARLAAPATCEAPCVEGCASDPGYILSGLDSVPYSQCGCTDHSQYYQINDTFLTADCAQRCTCLETGALLCEPASCLDPLICAVANYTRGCYRASPCLRSPCQNEGWCEDTAGGFQCHCVEGYTGQFCERVTDDAVPDTPAPPGHLTAILVGVLVPLGVIFILIAGVCLFRWRQRRKAWRGHRSTIPVTATLGQGDPVNPDTKDQITRF
ncbi:LOW QUALITY PROTEIN: zonadhesin [Dermochelys coriacea]|uniref:LOW QUALITY PROTEIN: zonadhesin n=1 Tax=Dermochelys coriacea TaxID=27794 RepID=UPI001CA7BDAE|nr:LOW QUALITY PROTEIN: zonadhesin [Dermochelys coriacea]